LLEYDDDDDGGDDGYGDDDDSIEEFIMRAEQHMTTFKTSMNT
jgi:hypothetical protein